MRKRVKTGIGVVSCACLCAIMVATAIADSSNAAGDFMLNKFSPYQEVDYQTDGFVFVDSRICIHGDKNALDIQYRGVLEKTTKQAGYDIPITDSSELDLWVCQSKVLD